MNPYLETLKDELREDCGEDICQADWDCFWDGLAWVGVKAMRLSSEANIESHGFDHDRYAEVAAEYAQGTRADLPSIIKYAYAAIEENLK